MPRRWRTGGDANRGMLRPAWVAGTAVVSEPGARSPNGGLTGIPPKHQRLLPRCAGSA
jgi:hypothetical protein